MTTDTKTRTATDSRTDWERKRDAALARKYEPTAAEIEERKRDKRLCRIERLLLTGIDKPRTDQEAARSKYLLLLTAIASDEATGDAVADVLERTNREKRETAVRTRLVRLLETAEARKDEVKAARIRQAMQQPETAELLADFLDAPLAASLPPG